MSQHNISPEQIENEQIYKEMGLSDEEYQLAKKSIKTSSELHGNRHFLCYVVRAL